MANDEFADAAEIARWFPIPPGSDDWVLKPLVTVTLETYSDTHVTNIVAKHFNYYKDLGGVSLVQGEPTDLRIVEEHSRTRAFGQGVEYRSCKLVDITRPSADRVRIAIGLRSREHEPQLNLDGPDHRKRTSTHDIGRHNGEVRFLRNPDTPRFQGSRCRFEQVRTSVPRDTDSFRSLARRDPPHEERDDIG